MGKRGSYVAGLRNAEAKGYEAGLSDAVSYECPYKVRRDLRNGNLTATFLSLKSFLPGMKQQARSSPSRQPPHVGRIRLR